MSEEEKTEEEETKPTETDTGKGDKPKETSIVEQANLAAERVEKANEEARKILQEQQELYARQKLGGDTEAGVTPKDPKEKVQDIAKAVMEQEGYDTLDESKKKLEPVMF